MFLDEFTRKNPIDNALDGDWIDQIRKFPVFFKCGGNEFKEYWQFLNNIVLLPIRPLCSLQVQNYENKNNDLVTSEVDKFHYEISGDNDEYLYKDTKMDSEFIGDEFTRKNPIDNALDGDWM
ncbi:hypothetical protein QTP88_015059 [Uroleucon formosanum]